MDKWIGRGIDRNKVILSEKAVYYWNTDYGTEGQMSWGSSSKFLGGRVHDTYDSQYRQQSSIFPLHKSHTLKWDRSEGYKIMTSSKKKKVRAKVSNYRMPARITWKVAGMDPSSSPYNSREKKGEKVEKGGRLIWRKFHLSILSNNEFVGSW